MKVILCDFCKEIINKSNLIKLKKINYEKAYDKVDDMLLATDVSVGRKIEICRNCYGKMIDYITENRAVQ